MTLQWRAMAERQTDYCKRDKLTTSTIKLYCRLQRLGFYKRLGSTPYINRHRPERNLLSLPTHSCHHSMLQSNCISRVVCTQCTARSLRVKRRRSNKKRYNNNNDYDNSNSNYDDNNKDNSYSIMTLMEE